MSPTDHVVDNHEVETDPDVIEFEVETEVTIFKIARLLGTVHKLHHSQTKKRLITCTKNYLRFARRCESFAFLGSRKRRGNETPFLSDVTRIWKTMVDELMPIYRDEQFVLKALKKDLAEEVERLVLLTQEVERLRQLKSRTF